MTLPLRCILFVLAMVTAAGTFAQVPGGGGAKGGGAFGGRGGPPPGGGEPRSSGPNLSELVNLRLDQLEEDLNLDPRQRPQWDRYRQSVQHMLDDSMRTARVAATAVELPAPKRLDALGDVARNRLTAVEEIVDAGKALYTILTPQQRTVADRRLALPLATLTGNDPGNDLRLRGAARPAGDAPAAGPGGGGPPPGGARP